MKVDIRKLKAANVFASKEETRYYLNGVFFELDKAGLNFVATDGHRAIVIPQICDKEEFALAISLHPEGCNYIIPRDLIERIKLIRGIDECEIFFREGKITIEYEGNSYNGEAVDGTFPDYKRIMPDQDKIVKDEKARRKELTAKDRAQSYVDMYDVFEIGFNPAFLSDFAKINTILGYKNQGVRMTMIDRSSPVVITLGADRSLYTGVLMPMRV